MVEEGREFYGIRLGHEELAYMLILMRAKTLPGLEEDLLKGLDDRQKEAVLGASERSLVARGIIRIEEGENKVEIDPLTLSLLGTCVYPQRTSSLTVIDKGGNVDGRYYHARDSFLVEHSFPGTGVHEFTVSNSEKAMEERILRFIALGDDPPPEGEAITISVPDAAEVLDQMRRGGRNALREILVNIGLSEEKADTLYELFDTSDKCIMVNRVDFGPSREELQVRGAAFLKSPGGLWAFYGDGEDPRLMRVEPWPERRAKVAVLEYITGNPSNLSTR